MLDFGILTREYLDPIGIWVSLIAVVPIFWTWYDVVQGKRRRHKRWLEKACTITGKLPGMLVIDLLPGKDVAAAIGHFMASDEAPPEVPKERIISVSRQHHLIPDDMPALARQIQDAVGTVLRQGTDELYVFLAGPGFASAIVGAELANISCRVMLFHLDLMTGTYKNFGPLRHPRF